MTVTPISARSAVDEATVLVDINEQSDATVEVTASDLAELLRFVADDPALDSARAGADYLVAMESLANELEDAVYLDDDGIEVGDRVLASTHSTIISSKRTGEVTEMHTASWDDTTMEYVVDLDGSGEAHVTGDVIRPIDSIAVDDE